MYEDEGEYLFQIKIIFIIIFQFSIYLYTLKTIYGLEYMRNYTVKNINV